MGLIGGIARTAVAAGTWTAVSNAVSRRQAGRWSAQDQSRQTQGYRPPPPGPYRRPMFQPPPPPPPPAPYAPYAQPVSAYPPPYGPPPPGARPPSPTSPATASDPMAVRLEQLRLLGELKATGVLTEAEFEAQKRMILGA
jgi:hypothetical protein